MHLEECLNKHQYLHVIEFTWNQQALTCSSVNLQWFQTGISKQAKADRLSVCAAGNVSLEELQ